MKPRFEGASTVVHLPGSSLGLEAFAHFARFPADREVPAPLVVWMGGAITPEEYERRRSSEPAAILEPFGEARERCGRPACDLAILSSPPTLYEGARPLARWFEYFGGELLPALPRPIPTILGLVGNSFGAHLATGTACQRADVAALATIAGVGMAEAEEAANSELPERLAVRCFVNELDFAAPYAAELARRFKARGRRLEVLERRGDHPFSDYAANGSVADAFSFVLEVLSSR